MKEQMILAACLACALCCLLAMILAIAKFKPGGKKAPKVRAFCDLLDYASLADDSVIVLKNGALMQCYRLDIEDLDFEESGRTAHLQSLVAKAFLKLGGGWAVHADVVRRKCNDYLPYSESGCQLIKTLDETKKNLVNAQNSFETSYYLCLTYLGHSRTKRLVESLVVQKDEGRGDSEEVKQTLELIDNFKVQCQSVMQTFSLAFKAELLKLRDDESGRHFHEALQFIHECITSNNHAVAVPDYPVYLDALLSTADFKADLTPKIGDRHICVVAVDGLPSSCQFLAMKKLSSLALPYRFNTRFLTLDELKSSLMLDKYRRFWSQRSRGILAQIFNLPATKVNLNALSKIEEIDMAKSRLDAKEEIFGSYSANVILMDENFEVLEKNARAVVEAMEDLGFGARIESVNAVEAYLGSLPGHSFENLRRPLISHQVLSDLLPLSKPWSGERNCPNPLIGTNKSPLMQVQTEGNGAFYLNLHDKDLGNTIVIGPPGTGKSVLLGEIILNFLRYKGARIFAFDKGYSFYALTKALGGDHFCFDNTLSAMCPLQRLESSAEFDYGLSFVEFLFAINGHKLEPKERLEITDALEILKQKPKDMRSLSDLHLLLSSQKLKDLLAPYTILVNPNSLLDGTDNIGFEKSLTTFECSSLFESQPRVMLPILKHVFYCLSRSFDGRPTAIVLDEAWMMLRQEQFAGELLKWFKTLRKDNVMVILATQSLTDISNSGYFEAFLECAKTRIFLPNYDAKGAVLSPVYQKMGLNEAQINTIATMIPKSEYLFKKGARSRIFKLILGRGERTLLSFAGNKCVGEVNDRLQRCGSSLGINFEI